VAEKYQIQGLKLVVGNNMESIMDNEMYLRANHKDSDQHTHDFIRALQIIFTSTTTHDDRARKVMLEACVANLGYIHQKPEFSSLLMGSSSLAVEMIGHEDLECGLSGDWVCGGACIGLCTITCYQCKELFCDAFARKHRNKQYWTCNECGVDGKLECGECEESVSWQRRGLG
jgi:hypothetical protein